MIEKLKKIKNIKKNKIIFNYKAFLTLALLLSFAFAGSAYALGMPAVDRVSAERLFFMAYNDFLSGKPSRAIANLDEALKQNTFFVDTYLLKALALRRLGEPAAAAVALGHYLEVRRFDERARIMKAGIDAEAKALFEMLRPKGNDFYFSISSSTLPKLHPVPVWKPLAWRGMAGVGKISSSNAILYCPDQLGGVLYAMDSAHKRMSSVLLPSPVVALPLTADTALALCADGEVSSVWINKLNAKLESKVEGKINAAVSDAAMISSAAFAVADRLGGLLRLFKRSDYSQYASWAPKGGLRFEPVAVDVFGPYIAVADRGSETIYVLDSYTLVERAKFKVPLPRDIMWTSEGGIIVLNENGELYQAAPDGVSLMEAAKGLQNAWTLCSEGGRLLISDTTARNWWQGYEGPGNKHTVGYMTLSSPRIEQVFGTNTLALEANPGSPYKNTIATGDPIMNAVWRGKQLQCNITPREITIPPNGILLSDKATARGIKTVRSLNMGDLWRQIDDAAKAVDLIILDSRVSASEKDMLKLLGFCIYNSVRLDVIVSDRPPSELLDRARRLTQGHIYWEENIDTPPAVKRRVWDISIPLPVDDIPSGYPSEAIISFFASEEQIWFRDWLPFWPSLTDKNNYPE